MLFGIFLTAANLAVSLTQSTTSIPPTWGQKYYEQSPFNPGFDNGSPDGKHDRFAQPLPASGKPREKNFILVIPDGFGPASEVQILIQFTGHLGTWTPILSMAEQSIMESCHAS